jgi:hypothetical protein
MMRWPALIVGSVCMLLPAVLVTLWIQDAKGRLREAEAITPEPVEKVAVAAAANESYCTPELKKILRRVLQSCGLLAGGSGRGCQPLEARNVATMSGDDFNALFVPMKERGGIVQFEQSSSILATEGRGLIDRVFADRRGASYFLVVSRASPEGALHFNRKLSQERAEAALQHLQDTFNDPDLDRQVGLLWLGAEYAQLDPSFCDWTRSGAIDRCTPDDLNRSAFIAWIDCRL